MAPVEWVRVSRGEPCAVCGKPDWCTRTRDGAAVCCMRTPGERSLRNGGWLHQFVAGTPACLASSPVDVTGVPRVPASALDRAYRALLAELDLLPLDRAHLLGPSRGLSLEAVARNGYRSLPGVGRAALCRSLTARVGSALDGVPGFYRAAGRVGEYVCLAGPAGLLIPVRDVDGRVVGLQVRFAALGRKKYCWVSSAGRPGGVGSGSPTHVARPIRLRDPGLWVTEGPLKADIAAQRLGAVVLGIAGTAAWRSAHTLDVVQALRPSVVTVAFDQDGHPATFRHASELALALADTGVRVRLALWRRSRGKGIDDVLIGGGVCHTWPFGR